MSNLITALLAAALGLAVAAGVSLGAGALRGFVPRPVMLRLSRTGRPRRPFLPLRWWANRKLTERRRELDRAVTAWVDMMYVAAASGAGLHDAVRRTSRMADEPLRDMLLEAGSREGVGGSLVDLVVTGLEEEGGEACRQVAHLLSDASRRGSPLSSVLSALMSDLQERERHMMRARLKTLGLKITLGTVFLLLPPAFVVVLLPSLLAFFSW